MPNERLDYKVGDTTNGQLVQVSRLPRIAMQSMADILWSFGAEGRVFVASDADQNDTVTGQTSFANTTPTFVLDVPAGTIAVPIAINLSQTGVVAGGAIDIIIEADNKKRYSSGTAETIVGFRKGLNPKCGFYSTVTATAGYGVNLWRATLGQDVSPAEGAIQGPFWKPEAPYFLEGPASLLVYTYAGTTGPTWFWNFAWLEFPVDGLSNVFPRVFV